MHTLRLFLARLLLPDPATQLFPEINLSDSVFQLPKGSNRYFRRFVRLYRRRMPDSILVVAGVGMLCLITYVISMALMDSRQLFVSSPLLLCFGLVLFAAVRRWREEGNELRSVWLVNARSDPRWQMLVDHVDEVDAWNGGRMQRARACYAALRERRTRDIWLTQSLVNAYSVYARELAKFSQDVKRSLYALPFSAADDRWSFRMSTGGELPQHIQVDVGLLNEWMQPLNDARELVLELEAQFARQNIRLVVDNS